MCGGAFISQLVWARARFCVHVEVQIGGVEEAGGQEGAQTVTVAAFRPF